MLSASLELAINQALLWSSNADDLLASLATKRCVIYVQELEQALLFTFLEKHKQPSNERSLASQTSDKMLVKRAEYVQVSIDQEGIYHELPDELDDNTCWVSVSLFALDKLKQNNQLTKLIKSGQLDFAGDLSILQGVSRLFDKLDIDFEEVLSGYVGDAPAYQLNTRLKQFKAHAQSQFEQFTQTLSDAALDEKPIAVRKIMLLNFVDEVGELRTNVDRLEARLSILEEKRTLKKGKKAE
jgi:ubiquinone biosynthesis protein UbiJ